MIEINDLVTRYKTYIYQKYQDLLQSGKTIDKIDNFDLAKIFEYYSCIKLSEEYKQIFYEYSDIDPDFKEKHNLSKNDTGNILVYEKLIFLDNLYRNYQKKMNIKYFIYFII